MVTASDQGVVPIRHCANANSTSTEGYSYAVNLEKLFFDTVGHRDLIEVLSEGIKEGRVTSLIHRYLNAGVMKGGKYEIAA